MRDRITRRAGHRFCGVKKRIRIPLARHIAVDCRYLIIADRNITDADIARIGDKIVIGQHITDRVKAGLIGSLGQSEHGLLISGNSFGRRRRCERPTRRCACRARIIDNLAGVEIRLRDRIRRRADHHFRRVEHIVAITHGGDITDDRVNPVIRDRNRADPDIARISQRIIISQHITHGGEVRFARDLGHGERR